MSERSPIYFVKGEGETHVVTIPDGFRLVCLVRDQSPSVVPPEIMPTGRYELQPELLPGGDWPMALTTCSASMVSLIEKMPSAQVNAIFDAVEARQLGGAK